MFAFARPTSAVIVASILMAAASACGVDSGSPAGPSGMNDVQGGEPAPTTAVISNGSAECKSSPGVLPYMPGYHMKINTSGSNVTFTVVADSPMDFYGKPGVEDYSMSFITIVSKPHASREERPEAMVMMTLNGYRWSAVQVGGAAMPPDTDGATVAKPLGNENRQQFAVEVNAPELARELQTGGLEWTTNMGGPVRIDSDNSTLPPFISDGIHLTCPG